MKRAIALFFSMFLSLSLVACGSTSTMESAVSDSYANSYDEEYSVGDYANGLGYDYDGMETETEDVEITTDASEPTAANVQNQKLIYTADVEIDTLNFQESCDKLFKAVEEAGGFIESKYLSDDGGANYYYYYGDDYGSADDLRHRLSATVRVPSNQYADFMTKTSNLGHVRNSNENVVNMTRQYGTLQSQLEIYEVEYQSYMDMLANVTSDEAKLQIKSELTDIAIQISDIKTNMSYIDLNVDYSEITVTIQEVAKYAVVKEESTFFTRLADTFATSIDELGEFLEDLLFAIILNWYKWLFTIFMCWLFYKIIRAILKKTRNKQPNTMVIGQTRTGKSGQTYPSVNLMEQMRKEQDNVMQAADVEDKDE